jgi:hypothetical protein
VANEDNSITLTLNLASYNKDGSVKANAIKAVNKVKGKLGLCEPKN